jgi:DNA-binding CsgD family transcriptional regulator
VRAGPDPIRIIEAAYAWNADEGAWLDSVVTSCSPYETGGGVVGYTVRVGARTEVVETRGTASDRDTETFRKVLTSFPVSLAREVFAPTEFVGNGGYRLTRIVKAAPAGVSDAARLLVERMPSVWALISGDVTSRALVLCFPRRGQGALDEPFPHADSRKLGLVGAHLGSALRLRGLARPAAEDPETDAVLSPAGVMLHASAVASSPRSRDSLTQAVLTAKRARGPTRNVSRDRALDEWTALVQGRWTIIETVEHDGKRLLLARRNRMRSTELLDLTQDERDVVWLAALGHSYKYIGYELGVPVGTVSTRLRRAMSKLRVRSRTELLQRIGTPTESTESL